MPDLAVQRTVTIGPTGSQVILPKNPIRRYALLVNDGTVDAYLGMSAPGVLNTGIRVNNEGGSYEINTTNLFRGEINAISLWTTKLLVTEW